MRVVLDLERVVLDLERVVPDHAFGVAELPFGVAGSREGEPEPAAWSLDHVVVVLEPVVVVIHHVEEVHEDARVVREEPSLRALPAAPSSKATGASARRRRVPRLEDLADGVHVRRLAPIG